MGGEGKWFNKYPNYDLKHKRKILQMEGREPCPAVPYTYIRNKKVTRHFLFRCKCTIKTHYIESFDG